MGLKKFKTPDVSLVMPMSKKRKSLNVSHQNVFQKTVLGLYVDVALGAPGRGPWVGKSEHLASSSNQVNGGQWGLRHTSVAALLLLSGPPARAGAAGRSVSSVAAKSPGHASLRRVPGKHCGGGVNAARGQPPGGGGVCQLVKSAAGVHTFVPSRVVFPCSVSP